jgi:hypothetical protein
MEKKLTQSQLELVRLKQGLYNQTLQQLQDDWQATLQLIANELGIENLSDWQFAGDKFVKNEKEENDGQQKLNFDSETN